MCRCLWLRGGRADGFLQGGQNGHNLRRHLEISENGMSSKGEVDPAGEVRGVGDPHYFNGQKNGNSQHLNIQQQQQQQHRPTSPPLFESDWVMIGSSRKSLSSGPEQHETAFELGFRPTYQVVKLQSWNEHNHNWIDEQELELCNHDDWTHAFQQQSKMCYYNAGSQVVVSHGQCLNCSKEQRWKQTNTRMKVLAGKSGQK